MADIENSLEREGLKKLEEYFAELGLRAHRGKEPQRGSHLSPDIELNVRLPRGERQRVLVEFKANARRAPIEAALAHLRIRAKKCNVQAQPLIFSEYFGKPMRGWLRSQGVWFADLAGNRFFSAPGLLVDREVSDRPDSAKEPAPSVFADRNSRLLRYLIPRPPLRAGIRELARKIDLSPAAVSQGLKRLREMGHLSPEPDKLRLQDRDSLLSEWVSFYRQRFLRQDEDRFYVHARSAEAVIEMIRSQSVAKRDGYGLSLHAGASLVAPYVQFGEVHILVSPDSKVLRFSLIKALGAERPRREANLIFILPFYKYSFLFEARMIRGVRVVSDIQLYLDLSCFPRRGREQAQVILDQRIRPAWSEK